MSRPRWCECGHPARLHVGPDAWCAQGLWVDTNTAGRPVTVTCPCKAFRPAPTPQRARVWQRVTAALTVATLGAVAVAAMTATLTPAFAIGLLLAAVAIGGAWGMGTS